VGLGVLLNDFIQCVDKALLKFQSVLLFAQAEVASRDLADNAQSDRILCRSCRGEIRLRLLLGSKLLQNVDGIIRDEARGETTVEGEFRTGQRIAVIDRNVACPPIHPRNPAHFNLMEDPLGLEDITEGRLNTVVLNQRALDQIVENRILETVPPGHLGERNPINPGQTILALPAFGRFKLRLLVIRPPNCASLKIQERSQKEPEQDSTGSHEVGLNHSLYFQIQTTEEIWRPSSVSKGPVIPVIVPGT